ncbi:MAG: hypothetical protein M3R37_09750 [Actinomycetota bacterium]|nr:hypothetical protein [Actinomycetota bacterium]
MLGLWLNDMESLEAISQDDEAKGTLKELAEDDAFLLAVEDYLQRTTVLH